MEDAEWEKPAPSTSEGRSKAPKAAPKADGLTDIHDWPGVHWPAPAFSPACRGLCVLFGMSLLVERALCTRGKGQGT